MRLYIDTCVLPRCRLETAAVYRERFGPELGFELLPMFDIPEWEENLKQNLSLFQEGPLTFHEPVWGVEHTALPGTPGWQESMYHLQLTRKYADLLHPSSMVVHLNNCPVPDGEKGRMLKIALERLEELGCTPKAQMQIDIRQNSRRCAWSGDLTFRSTSDTRTQTDGISPGCCTT